MASLITKAEESWGTPRYLDEKMNDLKRKLEELNARKEDTESRTSTEMHPRKKLKKQVELWFRNVERINGEIQDLEQKIGERNVVSRGFLKRDVLKKIQEVEELFQRDTFHDSLVADDPGWIGQVLSTATVFGGAAKTCMEEIRAYLMDDDIHKIGVWGMGGVGKTTTMKLIQNELLKEKKFNIVIWITMSKEMSIIELQNRIAREMKVTLDEDETIRAGMIYEMLSRKGKYVLILDDLWDRLSLEKVGIPEPSNGSKVLVTTRSLDVCRYLKCREVKMPTLSKPDAWVLFSEKVGPDVLSHPDILPIVKSVAEECAGLPLAIVIISSSMNGVCNVHEWRNALHELRRHVKSVNGIWEEEVLQKLQFSYDRLRDEKVKHCFLFCALFRADSAICIDELINLWIAEGLVEEMDSMQKAIDKGHTILNKLENSCLIQKAYEGQVKLHDVVRDMALRIIGERFLVKVDIQLKEIPDVRDWNEDLERVSFLMNKTLQIPSQMSCPKCPKLTTLVLSHCSIKSIPECFFEQMLGLKTLALSYNQGLERLPNSISNLKNLTALLLSHCSIKSIPECFFEQMLGLKSLDLSYNPDLERLPNSISNLKNLTLLMLCNCSIKSIPECFFEQMLRLRILNLSLNLDLERLPNSISNLKNLTVLVLSNCSIKSIPECFFEQMLGLETLDLSYNRGLKRLPNFSANLENLTMLLLCDCKDLEKVPSFSDLEGLETLNLEGTNVKDIPHGMERLVNLKQLFLFRTRITEIGNGILAKLTSLQKLYFKGFVRAEEISGLRKLEFFEGGFYDFNEWKSFVQVLHASKRGLCHYNIFVGPAKYCLVDGLREVNVIELNGCDIPIDGIKILSNVERLIFEKCIVDLCDGAFLSRCIPVPLNIFSSLSLLNIFKCKNVKKLLSFNWVLHNLQNLVELIVEGCQEMEEIIASELELEEEEEINCPFFNFTLPKLQLLGLKNLPKLKSICGANGVIVCDFIKLIGIVNCPKLKRIPLNLSLQDDGQPSPPPFLRGIGISSKEWWELVEWDHPNAKSLLEPLVWTLNNGYPNRLKEA